jgi:hypothetical protein
MSEREGPSWSGEGKPVAAEVSERLRSILGDAESAADAIRHQAESDAAARRRAAETEALKIIEDARREAERFLADRIHRVSELSDEILDRGQSVVERLDDAEQVRTELAELVRALGETAARLANEVRAMPGPQTPELSPAAASPAPERVPEPAPVTPPEHVADPEPEPQAAADAADEPLAAPTPLRRAPIEPNQIDLSPAAGAEPDTEAEQEAQAEPEAEAEHEPTPEEIELLERVRAAERERASGDDPDAAVTPEPEDSEPESAVDGDAPELVEVVVTADEVAVQEPRGEPAGAGPDQALGARLVALQMAVAGGNRGEVESHLRRAFDLDEPGSILDDIFGSGTDAEKRVVWPEAG